MTGKRVLSVGQCLADHASLSRFLRAQFAAEVVPVDSAQQAVAKLRQEAFHLVLINRVFDADGESGLELIRQLRSDTSLSEVPLMLVSNYREAQEEAVASGAVPGFGKAGLGEPETMDRLRPYLT